MSIGAGIIARSDHYAAIKDDAVIGVVLKCSETQWGWYPLYGGSGMEFMPLHHALAAAVKFVEDFK